MARKINPQPTHLLTTDFSKAASGAKIKIRAKKLNVQVTKKILKLHQRGIFSLGDIAIKVDRGRSSVQWVIQQHKNNGSFDRKPGSGLKLTR